MKYVLEKDALEYVSCCLKDGGPLAVELLGRRQLGLPFTFLEAGASAERLSSFDHGTGWRDGWSVWLDWIENTLSAISNGVALAHNYEIDLIPDQLSRLESFVVTDECAYVLAKPNRESLDRMLRNMSQYTSIVTLTSWRSPISGQSIDGEQIAVLADAATYVLVGAYDEESFVCAPCR